MFWFAEGKILIDKTWTSVARLANSGPIRARVGDERSICGLRVQRYVYDTKNSIARLAGT